ncbi:hypothetical protein CVT26_005070 [Gymnopilus dilepis]|uniref:F-box domain-containing protein n=1 Tax=Gymnopilus dilepis TaxID=231916 RepID=A0A409W896_9AGAR|nr:hypothetical protein CVT26_005070 [Gymnopilus dilepis]
MHMQFSSLEMFLLRVSWSILLELFDVVDVVTLIALSKTSKALRRLFICYAQARWDPAKRYRSWFSDVLEFRRVLKRSGAVVSGSFALQYFDRTFYAESDMDLFVRIGGVGPLCDFVRSQGYGSVGYNLDYDECAAEGGAHIIKAALNITSYEDPLLGVYTFKKFVAWPSGRVDMLQIQVVVVDTEPVEHILFDFHSTAVMNFLTADNAIAVFPFSTFVQRVSYISKIRVESSQRTEKWISKYEERGFKMVGAHNPEEAKGVASVFRYPGDSMSWKIGLFPDKEEARGLYGSVFSGVGFEVLTRDNFAVTSGSYLRVAEPFVWR